jgi:hypothetical protein
MCPFYQDLYYYWPIDRLEFSIYNITSNGIINGYDVGIKYSKGANPMELLLALVVLLALDAAAMHWGTDTREAWESASFDRQAAWRGSSPVR